MTRGSTTEYRIRQCHRGHVGEYVSQRARLVSIGRFAVLVGLPKSTLRFYDEQGLMHPAHVDSGSRYRYYGLEQLDVAMTIGVLRDMGVPLGEIKAILDTGPEETQRVLEHHRSRMIEREREAKQAVRRLDSLLGQGEHALPYDIALVEAQPLRVVSRRAMPRLDELDAAIADLADGLRAPFAQQGPPPGAPRDVTLYHTILRRDGLIDLEVCVPVPEAPGDHEGSWVLKGGLAAQTIHRGPWDDIYLAYASLFSWVLRNGYEPDGPLREIYVADYRDTLRPSQYVTELCWLLA
jgi:DNA-binding transcriptional MerR regulator